MNITNYIKSIFSSKNKKPNKEDKVSNLEKLARIPEDNPDPVIEVDYSGKVNYMNPAAKKLVPEIATQKFSHPLLAGIKQRDNASSVGNLNKLSRIVNSGAKIFEEKVVFFPKGKFIRIYAQDITERVETEKRHEENLKKLEDTKKAILNILDDSKQLEKRLRNQHERMNSIISSMGEGLLVVDNDAKITMINPVAEDLLEVSQSEVLGKNWSTIVSTLKNDNKTPTSERSFSKTLKTGETIVTKLDDDHYYKTKSGRVFPIISITAPLETAEGRIGAVKVFRDATVEKESKALVEKKVKERTRELQEQRARLSASINSLPMGFFIIDTNHNIALMNPAMKEILGSGNNDWSFETIEERFKKNDIEFKNFCAHCRGGKGAYGVDDINFDNLILRIISVPITLSNNNVIGSAVLVEDVTEAKLLERSKDEFFAVASHELRTPLTAIRGNTALIQEYFAEKFEDKDFKEMISDMHESSVRLIDIVNDFLDVSRLEQGRITFKKENLDLVRVAKDVVDEFMERANDKGLKIAVSSKRKVIEVIADKDRIKQVLVNLVGNAIDYTNKGHIEVVLSVADGKAKVQVKDTGVGVSKANQNLLFKKFQQAGERVLARDVTRGTGMGLYISRLLMEGMGGNIYLESSGVGKGSVFTFTLPVE